MKYKGDILKQKKGYTAVELLDVAIIYN